MYLQDLQDSKKYPQRHCECFAYFLLIALPFKHLNNRCKIPLN